jgi:hypothetical protein
MDLGSLIKPSGMLAYSFIVLAIASAVLKMQLKVKWLTLKWHMWFGIAAFMFATLHVILVAF